MAEHESTVTATLSAASGEAVVLTVAASAGDFAVGGNAKLTIAAGTTDSTGTVTLTAVNDATDAADKSVTVTAAAAGGHGVAPPAGVPLAIADDDPTTVTLGRSGSGGIAEAGGAIDVTVMLGRALAASESVTVPLKVSGATVATHYTLGLKGTGGTGVSLSTSDPHSAQDPAVTLEGAGAQVATLRLTAVANDDRITRTVAIAFGTGSRAPTVTGSSGGTELEGGPLSVPIVDDDAMITVGSASAAEGDNLEFTVTLPDPAPAGGVTIDYATSDGRARASDKAYQVAVAGADYTAAAANATLDIAADDSTGTITVATLDDSTYESDHHLTVTLEKTTRFNISTTAGKATGTITDADDLPSFQFSAAASTVAEDVASGKAPLTVERTGTTLVPAELGYKTADGTAEAGTDYTAIASGSLTFAAADTSKTLDVDITDDGADEVAEAFHVDLSAAGHAKLGTAARHTVTVTDDDPTRVTLSAPATAIAEAAGTRTLTLTLGRKLVKDESLPVTLDFGGAAAFGEDYTLAAPTTAPEGVAYKNLASTDLADNPPTVTFTGAADAKDTSAIATLVLTAKQDGLDEGAGEAVTVGLGTLDENSGTNLDGGAAGTGTAGFTITDDDEAPGGIVLSVDPASVDEDAAAAVSVTVTATVSGGTTYAQDTTVAITVGDAADGATSVTDYKAVTGFDIVIPAGRTSHTGSFSLDPEDDNLDEADETVTVSGASGSLKVTGTSVAITDDDDEPQLGIDDPSVAEGHSGTATLTFTVTLDAASGREVTVNYADAGTGTAASGTDFTAITAGTLTFAAGDTSETVAVTISGDTLDEANETVVLRLSSPVNATFAGDATTLDGTGTITDDDAEPTVSVADAADVDEGNDTTKTTDMTFAVTLSAASGKTVTVPYTLGGTATAGDDYTDPGTKSVDIAAGATGADIVIPVKGDAVDEPNETVTVALGSPTNATVSDAEGAGEAAGTITDDEDTPTVTLKLTPSSIDEADDTATAQVKEHESAVTAMLSGASSEAVVLTVSASAVLPAVAGDFTLSQTKTLTIGAGATASTGTVTVTAVDNEVDAANRTVTVSATATGGHGVTAPADATLTIEDDDERGVTVSKAAVTVREADDARTTDVEEHKAAYTVKLASQPTGGSVTVNLESDDATVATVSPANLTFTAANWGDPVTVTVTAVNDSVDNAGDEREVDIAHTVSASGTDYADETAAKVAVTVTDDDGAPGGITLTVDTASVAENASPAPDVKVTATVTGGTTFGTDRTVRVTIGKASDGAKSGTDYKAVAPFDVEIKAGATSGSAEFKLEPMDDDVDEANGSISVEGALSGLTVTGTAITLTDDDERGVSVTPTTLTIDEADDGDTAQVEENEGEYAVELTSEPTDDVTVTVRSADTAIARVDKTSLTFTPEDWDTAQTVTVTAVADAYDNTGGKREVNVTHGVTAGDSDYGAVTAKPVAVTVTDDDDAPMTIDLTVDTDGDTDDSQSDIAEDAGATTVTVTATLVGTSRFPAAQTVRISVGAQDDAAESGGDYKAVADFDLTIPAGAASGSAEFELTPEDDDRDEPDEALTVTGTLAGVTVNGASVTVKDDDEAPGGIVLSVDRTSVDEDAASAVSVTVTATVSGGTTYAQDVTVSVTVGDSTDAAESVTDYEAVAGFDIVIPAGRTSHTGSFSLDPEDDGLDEADESISVAGTSGDLKVTGTSLAITDDDDPPQLGIDGPSVAEGHSATATLTFTVTLDAASGREVTVNYADASTGSATSGTDYTAVTAGTLTFAAGDTSETVAVTVNGDTTDEANETVVLRLSSPVNATLSGGVTTLDGTGTITDDDAEPTVSVADAAAVKEGNDTAKTTDMTFTVTLSAASGRKVTVPYTLGGTATAGDDYTAPSPLSVDIAAGTTTASIVIPVKGDTTDEPNETVTVTLGVPTNATVASTQGAGTATGTITDDDDPPTVSVEDAEDVDEGNDPNVTADMTFTLRLSAASGKSVTVPFTLSGTATAGDDYVAPSPASVTIAPGTASASLVVAIKGDALHESDETVTVTLGTPTNATVSTVAGENQASGLISDDEGAPAVTLELTPTQIDESGNANSATVTASLSGTSSAAIELDISASPAASVTLSNNPRLSIAAGATSSTGTVTVTAVDNADDAADTEVTVSATASGGRTSGTPNADLTIRDDEPTEVTLSAAGPLVITERVPAHTARMTLSLSRDLEPDEVAVVPLSLSSVTGAALTGSTPASRDFVLSASGAGVVLSDQHTATPKVTFTGAAGVQQTATLTVTPTSRDDGDTDLDRVKFTLGALTGSSLATNLGGGLEASDDGLAQTRDNELWLNIWDHKPAGVTLSVPTLGHTEGAEDTSYTVVLDQDPRATVTVKIASGDADAAKPTVDTLTFTSTGGSAWNLPQTVRVRADIDDDTRNETVTFSHTVSAPSGNPYNGFAAPSLTVSVTDFGSGLLVRPPEVSMRANGGTASYQVQLKSRPTADVTVTPTSDDEAVATVGGAKTFRAATWNPGGTLVFEVTGVGEGSAIISNTTSSTDARYDGLTPPAAPAVEVTVDPDPRLPVELTAAESVAEGANLTLTASIDTAQRAAIDVPLVYANDTAEAADYTPVSSIRIAAGATSATATLATADNAVYEGDETFTVAIGDLPADQRPGDSSSVEVTIDDEADAPSFAFAATAATVGENAGTATLTVSRTGATEVATELGYATADDTAAAGADYTGADPGTLGFPAADASKSFTVAITDDTDDELSERFHVDLKAGKGAKLGTDARASVTITDNDPTPVTLSASGGAIAEASGTKTLTLTLGRALGAGESIRVPLTFSGAAAFGDDYTLSAPSSAPAGVAYANLASTDLANSPPTVTFTGAADAADTSATATVTLTAAQDTLDEGAGEGIVVGLGTLNASGLDGGAAPSDDGDAGTRDNELSFTLTDDDDPPDGIELAVGPASLDEDADDDVAITVTASVAGGATYASATTVTVSVGAGTDSATEGTDYDEVDDFDILIPAGATSATGTFDLTPVDDDIDEGEKERLSVTGASGSLNVVATGIDIADDDARGVEVSKATLSVAEADDPDTEPEEHKAEYTLVLTSEPTGDLSINVASGDEGIAMVAPEKLDFTPDDWDEPQKVVVTGVDDSADNAGDKREVDLSHTLSAAGTDYATGVTIDGVAVTITDDDEAPGGIVLSVDPASVDEDAAAAVSVTVTATVSGGTTYAQDTTVAITVGDAADGATSVTDYKAVTGFDIVIPAGRTSHTGSFSLDPEDDNLDEADETVTVSGASGSLKVTGTSVAITDDDDEPQLGIDDPSVAEGHSGTATLTFTVTLDAASGREVTVNYADAGTGTAASGTDFTAITAGTLTFAAGDTSETVAVTISGDTLDEANETVVLRLSSPVNATFAGDATTLDGTGTITDDDAEPTVSVADAADVDEGNDTTKTTDMTFAVTLSAASGKTVTVPYTLGGTATAGDDYTDPGTKSVDIAAGATGADIVIPVKGDAVDEPNETVTVALGSPTNATVSDAEGAGEAAGTITDDEDTPTVTLKLTPSSIDEADDTATAQVKEHESAVTAMLSGASSEAVVLTVSASAVLPAVAGDFTLSQTKTLTIGAGATASTGTVTVTAVDNEVDAANRTVTVSATATGGHGVTAPADATLTIEDDDERGVTVSKAAVTVREADDARTTDVEEHKAAYTVKLASQPTGGSVTVNLESDDATVATVSPANLTFTAANWGDPVTVTVTAVNDSVDNAGDEREVDIAHTVSASGTDYADETAAKVAVTVTDDDGAPGGITLTVDTASVAENASPAPDVKVTATVTGGTTFGTDRTVRVTIGKASDGAKSGTDYKAVAPFDVEIKAGATSGSAEFKLEPMDDDVDEANGSISVEGALSGLTVTGTAITLTDDDERGVSVTPTTLTIDEADDGDTAQVEENEGEYAVELTSEPTDDVTVTVRSADTAIARVDKTSLTFTPEDWDTAQTVTVTAVADAYDNTGGKREVNVTHGVTAGDSDYGAVTAKPVAVTVTDDDDAPMTIDLTVDTDGDTDDSQSDIAEDAGATTVTVTATLVGTSRFPAAQTVRISVGAQDDAAESGGDYKAVADFDLTIPAGAASGSAEFELTPEDDDRDEPDEALTVTGTLAGVTVNGASVTVKDDDEAPGGIVLSVDRTSVDEDAASAVSVTVTATVSGGTTYAQDVTVSVTVGDSTDAAESVTDYEAVAGFDIVIPAGRTSHTGSFSLDPEDDGLDEADESISVAGTSGDLKVTGTSLAITDDDDPPQLGIDGPSVAEGHSATATLTFTVTLDAASGREVTVNYADASTGSATSGTDYTAVTAGTLTFAAGDTSETVAVTVNGDTTDEANETVVLRLSSPVNATLSGGVTTLDGTGTITDDDAEPTVSVADAAAVKEGNDTAKTTDMTFTVTLSAASGRKVTVPYTLGGTATAGDDYTAPSPLSVDIAAGTTTASIVIPVKGDAVDEPNETVTVALGSPTNATVSNAEGAGTATGTITDDEDTPTVRLVLTPSSIDEADDPATTQVAEHESVVTATLSAASGEAVVLTVAASAGDFAVGGNAKLTIAAGATASTGTVTLTAVNDATDAADRSVTVTATATGGHGVAAPAGVPLAIADDDPTTVTLGRSGSGGIAEAGGAIDVTVTLGRALAAGESVTVPLKVTGATVATHYTLGLKGTGGTGVSLSTGDPHSAQDPAVTLEGAGARVATLRLVAVANDDRITRTVAIAFGTGARAPTVTGSSGGTDLEGAPLSIPIIDDDAMITVGSASAAEGDNLEFTVTLPDPAPAGGVTIDYATSDGRARASDKAYQVAVAGADYTAAPANATLSIAADGSTGTITVATLDDSTYESDHYLTVTLKDPSHFNISATNGAATGTITDDADLPSFQFSAAASTVAEDVASGKAPLTVERTGTTLVPAELGYKTADGTAEAGTDYTAIASGSLTFAAADTSKTLDVDITDDGADEVAEAFHVDLSAAGHAKLGTAARHTVTVTDDDPTRVTLSAPATAIAEAGGTRTLTLTLGRKLVKDESLPVTLDFGGAAAFGEDYTLAAPTTAPEGVAYKNLASTDLADNPPTVTFTGAADAKDTSAIATLVLTAKQDGLDEGAGEAVTVGLGTLDENSGTNLDGGAAGTGTAGFTITDDDEAPGGIVLSVDPASVDEDAAAAVSVTVTATVSGGTTYAQDTTVAITVGDAADGATSVTDYKAVTGFDIVIPAGRTSHTGSFSLDPEDDNLDEADETVTVSGASGSLKVTGTSVAITDDDDEPQLGIDDPSVAEGHSGTATLTFTVTLDAASGREVTVNYADAGTGTAASGTDFTAITAGTLTFAAGDTSETVAVTISGDTLDEANETVVLRLSSPVNATFAGDATTLDGTGTITDDDAEPTVSVADAADVDEGNDTTKTTDMTFAVTLSAASGKTVTVPYTLGGTATAGDDYTDPGTKSVDIAAGATGADIVIPVKGDAVDEPNETVTVALGSPTNATVSDAEGAGEAAGTITDDEDTPTVSLTLRPESINESGAGNASGVKATLSGASSEAVVLTVSAAPVAPAVAGDFSVSSTRTLTIAAGATASTGSVTVTAVDNEVDAANRTVTVSATATGGHGVTAPADATLTIEDDDTRGVVLSRAAVTVREADDTRTTDVEEHKAAYTVKLASQPTGGSVTVNLESDDATVATVSPANLTFTAANWGDPVTVTVTAVNDNVDNAGDEREVEIAHTVSASGTDYADVTAAKVAVTVTDDDGAPGGITLTVDTASVSEDASPAPDIEVTATVTGGTTFGTDTTVRVTVGKAADGAKSGTDYKAVAPFDVEIEAGAVSGSAEFKLEPMDDDVDEANGSISVEGALSGLTVTGTAITLTDDDPTTVTLGRSGSGGIAEAGGAIDVTVTLGRALAAGESVTVPLKVTGATVATHYTLGLKGTGGTGVSISTTDPHSAQDPAVTLGGEGAQVATLRLTAVANDDRITRTVAIAFGTGTRAPSVAGSSGGTKLEGSPLSVPIIDDDAMITVAAASAAEGSNIEFTVTLPDPAPAGGVTIDYATSDGRGQTSDKAYQVAVASQDYTAAAANATLTIAQDDSTGTITVATLDDSTYESDHYLTVTLEDTTHFNISVTAGKATGMITDAADLPSFQFSAAASTVAEDVTSGKATLTVSRTGTTLVPATLGWATADGTAKAGEDYTAIASGSLTFAAGDTSKTLDVDLIDDGADEAAESFRVDLSAANHAKLGTIASHTVTVTDDDPTTVTLSATSTAIAEADGSKTVTLALGRALVTGESLSVPLTFDGAATFNDDYIVAEPDRSPSGVRYTNFGSTALRDGSPTVIFSGGVGASATATLTVEARDDQIDEGTGETVTVGLATLDDDSGTGLDGGAAPSDDGDANTRDNEVSFTITDDDDAPTGVALSVDTTTIAESAAARTVTVTATVSGSTTYAGDKTIEVTVGKSDDSAGSGVDYAAVTSFDVTISAGEATGKGTFRLAPADDEVDENNETISVEGALSGLTVTGTSITLTDDDTRGVTVTPVTLTLDEADDDTTTEVKENEGEYEVVLTSEPTDDVTVTVTSGDATIATVDRASLTFKPTDWDTAQTVTVTAVPDAYDNADDKRKVAITHGVTAGDSDYGAVTVKPVAVTVNDDDGAPTTLDLSVTPTEVDEDAGATKVTVTATVAAASRFPAAQTVRIGVGANGDGAGSGTDYTAVASFDLTIAAGAASGSAEFELTPTDDALDENAESLSVTGTSGSLTVNGASIEIADDDTRGVTVTGAPVTVAEADDARTTDTEEHKATYTVVLDSQPTGTVTLNLSSAAEGIAAVSPASLTFLTTNWDDAQEVTVTGVDDDVDNPGDERTTLIRHTVSAAGTDYASGVTVPDAAVTVNDDDGPPTGIVLTLDTASVAENVSSAPTVTVTASVVGGSAYAQATTVSVSVGAPDDTAAEGTDYAEVADFDIVIPATAKSAGEPFTLTPTDDAIDEDSETVSITGVSGSIAITGTSIALTDDDTRGVTVTPVTLSLEEADDATTLSAKENEGEYEVVLTSEPTDDVTVTVTSGDAAIATVDRARLTFAPDDWSEAQTVTVTAVPDAYDNTGDKREVDIAHGVTAGDSDYGAVTAEPVAVTVTDDDDAPTTLDLSVTPAEVDEDAGATKVTVTATLAGMSRFAAAQTVRIGVGANGDGATSADDYKAVAPFDLTVAAGAASGSAEFELTPTDDDRDEGDEALTVSGALSGVTVNGTSVTIEDDDDAPGGIVLSVDPASVDEDASAAVSVTVTATVSGSTTYAQDTTVAVTVGDQDDDATSVTDYKAVAPFDIVIPAGGMSHTGNFSFEPEDDDFDEADESVTVSGASGSLKVTETSLDITDDDDPPELSVDDPSVAEGNSGGATLRFAVTLDAASGREVTVGYADAGSPGGGTATSGMDYTAVTAGTLKFAAGETEKTVAVSVTGDTLDETNETVVLRLSSPVNATLEGGGTRLDGTGTITDDDPARPSRWRTLRMWTRATTPTPPPT